MTKARKLVALMLAFLMIFSSASVLAMAMNETVDAGTALTVTTKFFKEVDGTWIETTKVRPNDTVKARVYLGTDYYSGDSTLLFFYDKDFFTHSYAASGQIELEVNDAATGVSGYFVTNPNLQSQVAEGYITDAQLNDNGVFAANIAIDGGNTVKFDDSDWLFEFTLTVAADASGEGDLFTVEELYQTTTRTEAYGDVPKGIEGGKITDAWSMWTWDADFAFDSNPVSTFSTVTFNANGGTFADGNATFGPIEGTIDAAIAADAIPADPTYPGYTFLGWVDAAIANPTESDIVEAPTAFPENDLVLNAYWVKNVNITFANTGDTTIDPITNVTPNTEFKDIVNPTKEGYTFVGWDVRGGELPEVYPSVDTTYTAVWATNVSVSFETNGAAAIPSVEGFEGAPFEATIADPQKEGHYFVGWLLNGSLVDLPEVFPATDVTYEAIFDTYTYYVTYFVKNEKTGETSTYFLQAEYGAEIGFPRVQVPEGYAMDSQWYTDADCTVPFVAGTTMGTAPVTLYTTIDIVPYKAYFILEEGDDLADAYAVYDVEYLEDIPVPADPSKDGYVFAGWSPYVGILDKEEDVVFYATWAEEIYNVAYYLNDGTTTVYETYDVPFTYDIEVPAAPVREGYTFIGWNTDASATTALNLVGATMPNGNVDYYAIWNEDDAITATYYVDGVVYETFDNLTFGGELEIPAPPVKKGYRFDGWAIKGTTEIVDLQGMTVPAESVEFEAIFTVTALTVTYYDYEASDLGPAGTPTPAYVVYATESYTIGDAIAHPEAPSIKHYTFSHWEDAEGNVWADGAEMPASELALYAKYERDAVYLAVIEGTTGVIEKANRTDMEQWYVYGFTGRTFRATEVPKYFEVLGDGYYEIEDSELSGTFGTGAKLKVYDRVTGELVEEFYIIYFGDINGDGRVNAADSAELAEELAAPSWSNSRRGVPYRIKAADLDGNKRINANDSTLLKDVLSKIYSIDQETGIAS